MSSSSKYPQRLLVLLPDVGQSASKLRGLVSFLESKLDDTENSPEKKGRTKVFVLNAPYRKLTALRGAKERAWCDVEDIQKIRNYSVLTAGMKENLKESVKSVHDAIDKEADILGLEKSKCVALLGLGQGGVVAILAGLSYKGGLCNVTCTGTEGFPMKELVVHRNNAYYTHLHPHTNTHTHIHIHARARMQEHAYIAVATSRFCLLLLLLHQQQYISLI